MSETEHNVTVERGWAFSDTFTPVCSCGWAGSDWSDQAKARSQAQLHREGERERWSLDPDAEVGEWEPRLEDYNDPRFIKRREHQERRG